MPGTVVTSSPGRREDRHERRLLARAERLQRALVRLVGGVAGDRERLEPAVAEPAGGRPAEHREHEPDPDDRPAAANRETCERGEHAPTLSRGGLHESRSPQPAIEAVRGEPEAERDEAAEQDPLRLGDVQQLQPAQEEDRAERDPQHDVGQLHGEAARDQHAGNRAGEQPRGRVVVDVAADHVPDAGDPEERGRVEDVGADDLRHRQRIDEHHHEPEERAAADRRQADDEAEDRADDHREHLVAPAEDERPVVRLDAARDERLREEAETARDERAADGVALDRLRAVAVVVLDQGRDADAGERERARAEEHPERQPRVHGAEPAVADRAERLEDRAVQDVGADGVRRLEAEEDDEDRRHQRAAAHAGEADDRADQQARERELPGHALSGRGSSRRRRCRSSTRR